MTTPMTMMTTAAAARAKARVRARTAARSSSETSLQNKTAHKFPGAHPMRRVLTRVVVTDPDGNKLPYIKATGRSKFRTIRNQLAVLEGDEIMPGYQTVKVKYDDDREIVTQGQTPNLDDDGETVSSQMMDQALMAWSSPDGTVINSEPVARMRMMDHLVDRGRDDGEEDHRHRCD